MNSVMQWQAELYGGTDPTQPLPNLSAEQIQRERNIFQQGINHGYKTGYQHGFNDGVHECNDADDQAREAFHRAAAKSAAEAIDTAAAREQQRRGRDTP